MRIMGIRQKCSTCMCIAGRQIVLLIRPTKLIINRHNKYSVLLIFDVALIGGYMTLIFELVLVTRMWEESAGIPFACIRN